MMRPINATVLALAFVGGGLTKAQQASNTKEVKFPGAALKWLLIAQPEFARRHLAVDSYNIIVADEGSTATVMLVDPHQPEGCMGSCGKLPNFEVEIDKKDLKILHSNFDR